MANSSKWVFEEGKCNAHLEEEAVADLFE